MTDTSDKTEAVLAALRESDLDSRYLMYAIEMLRAISGDPSNEFKWLYSVNEYERFAKNEEIIAAYLEILIKIIDVLCLEKIEANHVNRLMSQFTNIINISRTLDAPSISNIKYLVSKLVHQTLNPDYITAPGFSQEGEDLILKRIFPADMKGFYVDVGAHHPTRFSNTYYFYQSGWRGINIDPRPDIMELFNSVRPNDINLEAAISDNVSEADGVYYVRYQEPAYNKIIFGGLDEHSEENSSEVLGVDEVEVCTLNDVIANYSDCFDRINLLSIDVEGLEMRVLNGFDIAKYMPDIVVLEVRGFEINDCGSYDEYNFMIDAGYKLRSVLYNSLIFQRIGWDGKNA